MKPNSRRIPPRTALATYEDAMAIASQARAWGFEEDANAMERFAAGVLPHAASLRGRWAATEWRSEATA